MLVAPRQVAWHLSRWENLLRVSLFVTQYFGVHDSLNGQLCGSVGVLAWPLTELTPDVSVLPHSAVGVLTRKIAVVLTWSLQPSSASSEKKARFLGMTRCLR